MDQSEAEMVLPTLGVLLDQAAAWPEISICRSTPTSHSVTPLSNAQYSPTGSP